MGRPGAEDTAEGVAEWWLVKQSIRRRVDEVEAALEDLVARELVTARSSEYSEIRYRINRLKLSEIKELLAEDRPRNEQPDSCNHR